MKVATGVAQHYQEHWRIAPQASSCRSAPSSEMPAGFKILTFPPSPRRRMWTYATCGMSSLECNDAIELHLFSPIETMAHVELLTAIAHYHITGHRLDLHHTVNFGRPWVAHSQCEYGLISLPYLDGPQLEWLQIENRKIHCLWLIPITNKEVEFKKAHGIEALESQFDRAKFDYLNPIRSSVV